MKYDYKLQKTVPAGKSKFEHYSDLTENIYGFIEADGAKEITVASDVALIFRFSPIFTPAQVDIITGAYVAGTLNSRIKIIVSPDLTHGEFKINNKIGIVDCFE